MKNLILIFILVVASISHAQQAGGDFVIVSSTIDSGGGTSTSGEFSLTGTIGQPDANPQISSGDGFTLAGGFWATARELIFRDGFDDAK